MNCNGNIHLHLYALTLLFPCNADDENHADITLLIEEETFTFTAERLQGGQCLLLPEETKQLIICSLLEKKCVEIHVGRYQTTLTHENFGKNYETLISNI